MYVEDVAHIDVADERLLTGETYYEEDEEEVFRKKQALDDMDSDVVGSEPLYCLLSRRQRRVVEALRSGVRPSDVAGELHVQRQTVDVHRRRAKARVRAYKERIYEAMGRIARGPGSSLAGGANRRERAMRPLIAEAVLDAHAAMPPRQALSLAYLAATRESLRGLAARLDVSYATVRKSIHGALSKVRDERIRLLLRPNPSLKPLTNDECKEITLAALAFWFLFRRSWVPLSAVPNKIAALKISVAESLKQTESLAESVAESANRPHPFGLRRTK